MNRSSVPRVRVIVGFVIVLSLACAPLSASSPVDVGVEQQPGLIEVLFPSDDAEERGRGPGAVERQKQLRNLSPLQLEADVQSDFAPRFELAPAISAKGYQAAAAGPLVGFAAIRLGLNAPRTDGSFQEAAQKIQLTGGTYELVGSLGTDVVFSRGFGLSLSGVGGVAHSQLRLEGQQVDPEDDSDFTMYSASGNAGLYLGFIYLGAAYTNYWVPHGAESALPTASEVEGPALRALAIFKVQGWQENSQAFYIEAHYLPVVSVFDQADELMIQFSYEFRPLGGK